MHILKKLTIISMFLAMIVVSLGAYVRLSDAGLGCPDWPGCYGTLTVPQSIDAIQQAQEAFPESPVEHTKAWKEMIHRYVAGILGFFILGIAFLSLKFKNQINFNFKLAFALVGLVIFQAALGMWTVTMLLKPIIVSLHLIGGMSVLAILTYMVHRHYGTHRSSFIKNNFERSFIRFGLILIFIQIFLGGWTSTNYAALACTDFPTCHGSLLPEMDFFAGFSLLRDLGLGVNGEPLSLSALHGIQWVHRLGAIIVLMYSFLLVHILRRNKSFSLWAGSLLIVVSLQFIVGISNLLLHLPIALATLHNFLASLLLMIYVGLNSRITDPCQN
jgi:cytochrome c oxidase assembly protein subunit 15